MSFFDFGSIPIYSLDISDESFKFLRLADKKNGTVVDDFGEAELEKGAIDGGEVKNREKLALGLKKIFSKKNIKFAAFSLPEEKGFLRTVRLSGMSREDAEKSIEFQIEEHVPLPASEVFFEYKILNGESGHFDAVINAFPKAVVESYLGAIESAGALPVCAESESESASRAILPKGVYKSSMIIDWGKMRASFSVFEDDTLKFTSTIFLGGKLLDDAISRELRVGKKEAQKIKFETNIHKSQKTTDVFGAIFPIVSSLKDEAEKILDYWRSHSEGRMGMERIFLSGGDANLFGLSEYLTDELRIETTLANPWVNIKFPHKYLPPMKMKDSLRFVSAIGLALSVKNMEKII
ncbi:MAG: pilus assembly protein PilM [Patescibacteria group bacterium]